MATVLAVTLTGCAAVAAPVATEPPAYSVEATLAAFRGYVIDYEPRKSPDEIAENSSVVVSGTVDGVREGRQPSVAGSAMDDEPTITLVLRDVDVVAGEPHPGTDGRVYVELTIRAT